ncbi:CPBP family intramembrane metalloprotease [Polaribacter vadi]|uniref:CPBP family intramembrane glutamic endopeptidase n=1 Tax=Polaribacter TaxID=52959 RepID=UPI001C07F1E7|nr:MULTISPECIES: type II CAAX endopeptidase family protein [Polaribacter]MBU3013034.1 CPBP family intramembrane metalloprotease [Polaribacter vadi]MDO6742852.1 type II CAAX endopeptidase family protein [Polaribacter sp. 1_MG-2023]
MNYIQQGYTGKLGMWKYLIIPILFFGLMALNFLAIWLLDLDVEKIMKVEIAKKGANRFLIESLAQFAVGLLALLIWVKFIHKQTITSLTTSRKKIDWKRVFFAFFLWASITTIFVVIDFKMSPENYQWNFDLDKFLNLVLIAVLLIPLQTSFEEYFFRGYLMQGLGMVTKNRWFPLISTSLVFGLLHIANPEVAKLGYGILVYYIGTGFFLGIITLMDEGLELALGFHAANNLITALLVTADYTVFQTDSLLIDLSEPVLGADVFVPVFVIFPILMFIFAKVYKWQDWKEKLTGKIEKPINLQENYRVLDEIGAE